MPELKTNPMSALETLVKNWRTCIRKGAPFVYPGDEALSRKENRSHILQIESFREYIAQPDFWLTDRGILHLGLLPQPYSGCLKTARVFVLMQNPGFSETDYYAESEHAEFRKAHIRCLRQENVDDEFPFVFLDPRFIFHSGAHYWLRKFGPLIDVLRQERGGSWVKALSIFARSIATLEYVPYHSRAFSLPSRVTNALESKKHMLDYVKEELVPRAVAGEVLVITARSSRIWGLRRHKNIIQYSGSEARAAHLSPSSRGGRAILDFLR